MYKKRNAWLEVGNRRPRLFSRLYVIIWMHGPRLDWEGRHVRQSIAIFCVVLCPLTGAFAQSSRPAGGWQCPLGYVFNGSGCGPAGGSSPPPQASHPPVHRPSPTELKQRQSDHFNREGLKEFKRGNFEDAIRFFQTALDMATNGDSVRVNRQNIANAHSFLASAAEKRGDLEGALREVKLALQYDVQKDYSKPKTDWPAWEKSLQDHLAKNKREADAEKEKNDQQQKAIVRMQTAVEQLDQAMNADASSRTDSGLDFIDNRVRPGDNGKTAALTPVNPPTVDARNVPSGLPKSVEDAIPRTPAGDRVRKGFEAIQAHDWKVARAWFQDALLKDPGNAGLQRLVDLAQHMVEPRISSNAKAEIAERPDGFKTTPQFEQQTRELVNASILPQYPEQLSKSKSLDEIAKETIRPDNSKFEDGDQISIDRAREIAHYSRLQALRSEATVHQTLVTSMIAPSERADFDALKLSQLSSFQMSYAAEVERCRCLPKIAP